MAIAIDGSATGESALTSLAAGALTTSSSDDIIIAAIEVNSALSISVSGVSGGGLTWAKKIAVANAFDGGGIFTSTEIWWAVAASPLSSQVITATATLAGDHSIVVFGISGLNTSSPFDSNASFPASVKNTAGASAPSIGSLSTDQTNDILLAFCSSRTDQAQGVPTGFTNIAGRTGVNNCITADRKIVSATQSNITIAYPNSVNLNTEIVLALTADSAAPPVTSTITDALPSTITLALSGAAGAVDPSDSDVDTDAANAYWWMW